MDRNMLVKTYRAATARGEVPLTPVTMCVDGDWFTVTPEEIRAAQRHRAFEQELGRLCGARLASRRTI